MEQISYESLLTPHIRDNTYVISTEQLILVISYGYPYNRSELKSNHYADFTLVSYKQIVE
jgi:hypothetical protein